MTFINEGMANWEKWKSSLAEKDRLKNAYQRSKLLGLKGQINPHFLFNCFNTLAELITDNEREAETFLEEMTKVHRYLLRSNDDYLVPVADEIKFAKSYLFLAKVRFGNAIDYNFNIHGSLLEKLIPPLSMQVILENIIYSNAINKNNPLNIEINVKGDDHLLIQHSLHQKSFNQIFGVDIFEGLDNLINKYKLLGVDQIMIRENTNQRRIILPIIGRKPIFA
jgi:LytS/YehU family sensor histidine kinase